MAILFNVYDCVFCYCDCGADRGKIPGNNKISSKPDNKTLAGMDCSRKPFLIQWSITSTFIKQNIKEKSLEKFVLPFVKNIYNRSVYTQKSYMFYQHFSPFWDWLIPFGITRLGW